MIEDVLVRKLERFGPLSKDDRTLLHGISANRRAYARHEDIIREGDNPDQVFLILEGIGCRYKIDAEGNRQIVGLLAPGDICDLHVFILNEMDHSISALSDCIVAEIPHSRVLQLLERPAIARGLWYATLIEASTLREWLVNIGMRSAERRLAHLICEMHLRLAAVGLASHGVFRLPISQSEFADLLGMSAVHANRSLQSLRETGLVTVNGSAVEIIDIEGLQRFAGFRANYLHLKQQ